MGAAVGAEGLTLKRNTSSFPAALVAWFTHAQRPMPWRETRDPYRVWLSEIMLQQTQVATVIPYYERFLARFPTVQALAAAPLDDVLKLWAGLGYYSRARNLHRGAQKVAQEFSGIFPDSLDAIRTIPGIGEYTAGAVLSIAYQKPEALVDGNVARVLSRMLLLDGDWRTGPGKKTVWIEARKLVADAHAQKINPGDFNQAVMELGATICSPRSPECPRCPVSGFCRAFKDNRQSEFPKLKARAAVPVWKLNAWVVRDEQGQILLHRRKDSGLFGGLFELPMERARRGTPPRTGTPLLARLKHVLTHRELRIEARALSAAAWHASVKQTPLECWAGAYESARWLTLDDLLAGKVALSTAQVRMLKDISTVLV